MNYKNTYGDETWNVNVRVTGPGILFVSSPKAFHSSPPRIPIINSLAIRVLPYIFSLPPPPPPPPLVQIEFYGPALDAHP